MRQSFTDDIGFFTRVHNAIIHVEYTSFHRGSPHSISHSLCPTLPCSCGNTICTGLNNRDSHLIAPTYNLNGTEEIKRCQFRQHTDRPDSTPSNSSVNTQTVQIRPLQTVPSTHRPSRFDPFKKFRQQPGCPDTLSNSF